MVPMMKLVSLQEGIPKSLLVLLLPFEDIAKAAIWKPGREPSPEPNHVGTLISDFSLQNYDSIVGSGQDGRGGRPWSHLLPQAHQNFNNLHSNCQWEQPEY